MWDLSGPGIKPMSLHWQERLLNDWTTRGIQLPCIILPNLFTSVWIHGYSSHSIGYNPLLTFFLSLIFSQTWSWRVPSCWLSCSFNTFPWFFSTSIFWHHKMFWLFLYLPCPSSEVNQICKESWFLLLENRFEHYVCFWLLGCHWTSSKLNYFALQKILLRKLKATDWEKIFLEYISDKRLVPRVLKKKLTKLNSKKTNNSIKNGPRIWTDTSPKKMHGWQMSIWKVTLLVTWTCKLNHNEIPIRYYIPIRMINTEKQK